MGYAVAEPIDRHRGGRTDLTPDEIPGGSVVHRELDPVVHHR